MVRARWILLSAALLALVGCGKDDADLTVVADGGIDHTPVVLVDLGITFDAEVDAFVEDGGVPPPPRPEGPPPVIGGRFVPGSPPAEALYVNAENGDDTATGDAPERALQTLQVAWDKARERQSGQHIVLAAGRYAGATFGDREGTQAAPVFVTPADDLVDGTAAVITGPLSLVDVHSVYLDRLSFEVAEPTALSCSRCAQVLWRALQVEHTGDGPAVAADHSEDVFAEDLVVRTAGTAGIEWRASTYGHVMACAVHGGTEAGIRARAGAAYLRVEGNDVTDAAAGYVLGPVSDVAELNTPWLHYEVYGVRVVNNLGRHLTGPAVAVFGGYNVLVAYNTFFRVAPGAAAVVVDAGARTCSDEADCAGHAAAGGWTGVVPALRVLVFDNLLFNPEDAPALSAHLSVSDAAGLTGSGFSFAGNVFWGAPASAAWSVPAGVDTAALDERNRVNLAAPVLRDAEGGDLRLAETTWLAGVPTFAPTPFDWGDRPMMPAVPAGDTENVVPRNRSGNARPTRSNPGAY